MTYLVLFCVIVVLIAINIFLWKSGFLAQAERPLIVSDHPVREAKEREAFLKRLGRWNEEGKVSREEYTHLTELCRAEWDPVE
jgi:hypothetical protein